MDRIQEFFDFVNERHMIYHKRFILKEEAPWTEDQILVKYKFCNVYRDLDSGTKWIVENADGATGEDKLFQIITYRFINNPDFFNKYGLADLHGHRCAGPEQLEEALREYRADNGHLFNTAYTTHKTLNLATKLKDTITSLALVIDWAAHNAQKLFVNMNMAKSAEESCKLLESIPGVGPFLAYEIWCDAILLGVHDWTEDDYCNVGPGAVAGLEIMFPENNIGKMNNEECVDILKALQDDQEVHFLKGYLGKRLTLRSFEHSLCEFRKYYNLKLGKGRPRLFKPKS